jgi:hypothetical protein
MNRQTRNEAVISRARVGAAHEGVAELVVMLTHGNGGQSEVALDHLAAAALLKACNASEPDQLIGQPWQKVRDALSVSWNRYQASPQNPL